MDTTKGPIPLCCSVNPYNDDKVCIFCEQTSCLEHQDPNGMIHTYCRESPSPWPREPKENRFRNEPYDWGMHKRFRTKQ